MRSNRPGALRFLRPFYVLALALSPLVGSAAAVCGTPGKDGVASSLSGVVNTYYAGSGTASGTSVTLGSLSTGGASTPIAAGDLILVMQMQDGSGTDFSNASTYGSGTSSAGQYEYATVASVSGSTLTLTSALLNTYTQSLSNRQTFQVVRVPQYASATVSGTLTAQTWTVDASGNATGGVLALDVAGALTLNANLDVSGEGFRGGLGINGTGNISSMTAYYRYPYQSNVTGASKGEGTAGTPLYTFNGTLPSSTPGTANYSGLNYPNGGFGKGAPGNAGGGSVDGDPVGGGNQYNAGGGGGANAGAGGMGGKSWSKQTVDGGLGGYATTPGTTRLFLGGGGGAGGTNNNGNTNKVTTYPPTSTGGGADGPITASGAAGGGAVLVRTGSLGGSSQILANGYRAYNMSGGSEAAGGGGAGGSVFLRVVNGTPSATISATGGAGGNSNYYNHGPGGGGGGGYVVTSSNVSSAPVVTGGASGVDGNTPPVPDGSVAGSTGTASTFTGQPANGVLPSAVCLPSLTVIKTTSTPTRLKSDTTASYTITVSNGTGLGTALGVALSDLGLPTNFSYAGPASAALSGGASGPAAPTNGGTASAPSFSSYNIPGGGSVALTFPVALSSPSPGTYNNSAQAAYQNPTSGGTATVTYDGTNASNTGDDVKVLTPPSLALTKYVRNITTSASSAFGSSVTGKPGDVLEYCINYANSGESQATSVKILDSIAAATLGNMDGYATGTGVRLVPNVQVSTGTTATPGSAGNNLSSGADASNGNASRLTTSNLNVLVGAVGGTVSGSNPNGVVCFQATVQ